MPRVRIADLDVHYQVAGDGPWLTLAHPLAADLRIWAMQMPRLLPHFRVLRFDARGHGETSASPAPYSLDQLADDAIALFNHLGITQTHWIGLSMGGMVAQAIALKHPGLLDRIVLADSTSRRPPNAAATWAERIALARARGMAGIVEPTLERWFTPAYRAVNPDLMAWVAEQISATSVEGYCGCCEAISKIDMLDRLNEIDSPALIMAGERDHSTPPEMSEQMSRNWRGSTYCTIPDAAHIGNVEQADFFNRKVAAFLGV